MNKFLYRIAEISILVFLAGCGGGASGPQNSADIESLEKSGKIQVLDRSSTLAGVDANQNGVRDDIDLYIEINYPAEKQKKAATQIARALQASLLVDKTNKIAVSAAAVAASRGVHCASINFPSDTTVKDHVTVTREIESITTNTKSRLLAYVEFAKALAGSVSSAPRGDSCE